MNNVRTCTRTYVMEDSLVMQYCTGCYKMHYLFPKSFLSYFLYLFLRHKFLSLKQLITPKTNSHSLISLFFIIFHFFYTFFFVFLFFFVFVSFFVAFFFFFLFFSSSFIIFLILGPAVIMA